jgi:hypothetical protein
LKLFSWRNAFFLASLALVASFFVRRAQPAVAAPPPPPRETCPTELAACRTESWNIVARTIRTEVEEKKPQQAPLADLPNPTNVDAQRRTRCDVAEQQAREHWVREKANIFSSVKDVGTPEWISKEVKKTLASLEKDLGIAPSARLEREYTTLWSKHGPLFQRALTHEPADWAALVDIVRAYYADEDALLERTLGAHVRDEHRVLELRSRTAIMAVVAALAEKPFDDESLAW